MVDRHKNYHQYLRNSLVILFSINISRFTTHAQLKNKLPFIGIFYFKLDSVTTLPVKLIVKRAKKLEKKKVQPVWSLPCIATGKYKKSLSHFPLYYL